MENCTICGKEINKTPHITCAECGSTVCYSCGKDRTACPTCGFNGCTK